MARGERGDEVGCRGAELLFRRRWLIVRVNRRSGRDRQGARFSLIREEYAAAHRKGRKSSCTIDCAELRARLPPRCGRDKWTRIMRTGRAVNRRKAGELERRKRCRRFARLSSLRRRLFRSAVLSILVWPRGLGVPVMRVVRMDTRHDKVVSPCRGRLVLCADLTPLRFIDFARRRI